MAGQPTSSTCRTVRCWCPTSRMARSIASRLAQRVDVCARQGVMVALSGWWRSLASTIVVALAAAAGCADVASAQGTPLAERIKQCGVCHGKDGNSRMPNIPSLAGQPEFFVMNQLFIMREGVRRIEAMMPLVKDLSDDELQGLARHFSALAPRANEAAVDPALVTRGAELAGKLRCGSCHLPTLEGQDQMPRLAKQR